MSEKKSLAIIKSSLAVSIVTVVVKLLGFFKQSVVAWCFGATTDTDIYYIADGFVGPMAPIIFSSASIMLLSTYAQEKKTGGKK